MTKREIEAKFDRIDREIIRIEQDIREDEGRYDRFMSNLCCSIRLLHEYLGVELHTDEAKEAKTYLRKKEKKG